MRRLVIRFADVDPFYKIRAKHRLMKLLSVAPRFGPFGQLPGKAAVTGLFTLAQRQAQLQRNLSQPLHHLPDVQIAARKEFFKSEAVFRDVGVKRKRDPLDNYVILFS